MRLWKIFVVVWNLSGTSIKSNEKKKLVILFLSSACVRTNVQCTRIRTCGRIKKNVFKVYECSMKYVFTKKKTTLVAYGTIDNADRLVYTLFLTH